MMGRVALGMTVRLATRRRRARGRSGRQTSPGRWPPALSRCWALMWLGSEHQDVEQGVGVDGDISAGTAYIR